VSIGVRIMAVLVRYGAGAMRLDRTIAPHP
jgi:hypothetical protein